MASPTLGGAPPGLAAPPTNVSSAVAPAALPNGQGTTSTTPLAAASASASPALDGKPSYFPSTFQGQARSQQGSPAQSLPLPLPGKAGSAPLRSPLPAPQTFVPPPQVPGRPSTASPALSQTQTHGVQSPAPSEGAEPPLTQSEMAKIFERASPTVLRQAIRDNWEKCMLGSEFHLAFLLNASFHQASPATMERAVKDFGGRMVKSSKFEIARHLDPQDLDDISDVICSKLSSKFLDKALTRRLESIDGRQLINALARAERLGYNAGDIIERNGNAGPEHVIPSIPQVLPPAIKANVVAGYQQPQPPTQPPPQPRVVLMSQQAPQQAPKPATLSSQPAGKTQISEMTQRGMVYCHTCHRPCSGLDSLRYHQAKNVCNKPTSHLTIGRDVCPHCGQPFGSNSGLNYHLKSKVCGQYDPQMAEAMAALLSSGLVPSHQPQQANTQTPTQSTPIPSTPSKSQGVNAGIYAGATPNNDPYAHLTPEQRRLFEADMQKGMDHYGASMRDAMKLEEPERSDVLTRLKNSYNTRQSTTRKKYGIRLRERRTKEQIDAERMALFGTTEGPSLTGSELPAAKRAKTDSNTATTTQQPAASQADTPRKRVPIAEMGGLGASSATAELTDPTATMSPSKPRFANQTPVSASAVPAQSSAQKGPKGTSEDPMAIDSSESDSSGSDDTDDEDIPAK